jgi:hypothetical protein
MSDEDKIEIVEEYYPAKNSGYHIVRWLKSTGEFLCDSRDTFGDDGPVIIFKPLEYFGE